MTTSDPNSFQGSSLSILILIILESLAHTVMSWQSLTWKMHSMTQTNSREKKKIKVCGPGGIIKIKCQTKQAKHEVEFLTYAAMGKNTKKQPT